MLVTLKDETVDKVMLKVLSPWDKRKYKLWVEKGRMGRPPIPINYHIENLLYAHVLDNIEE